ncbi:hypothetical protein PV11_04156 [Exophiala sideris]|uniref:Transcription factor domain-containing protein n=1 Tax=Exophiala sideris TaxID=1016849 RepID=A0A0D1W018_9EURO|nr:hypothetical protein PV11_04156 [Exophiala sideris]
MRSRRKQRLTSLIDRKLPPMGQNNSPFYQPLSESTIHATIAQSTLTQSSSVASALQQSKERDDRPHHGDFNTIILPSIVDGIDNSLDKRLLHHFTNVFARLLVTTPEPTFNPFINLIVPLALQDRGEWGLLDLILSLSASHLSRLLQSNPSYSSEDGLALEKAKWKRYSRAVSKHAKELLSLMNSSSLDIEDSDCNAEQIDCAMATTMFFCQWSTCEGGDHSNWNIHLNANRDLVRRKFDKPAGQPAYLSATSQALLEWFYFHDVIAALTFPNQDCCIDLSTGIVQAFGISTMATTISKHFSTKPAQHIMWIGPNDGLLTLISRTLSLRRSWGSVLPSSIPGVEGMSDDMSMSSILDTDDRQSELSSTQLLEALTIETALQEWSFEYETSQQQLMGQCYRLAAFLLLFFTVNPRKSSKHTKAQQCLDQLGTLIGQLSPNDNAITCSLLPLFIYGVSVLSASNRDLVLSQMDAYQRFCGLGHICAVKDFLQSWWKEQELVFAGTEPAQRHGHGHSFLQCATHSSSESCPTCRGRAERRSWWAWQDFMKDQGVQLILI